MKYSRGRLLALTILSVTMVLALFGAGLLCNFRQISPQAAANVGNTNTSSVPTFDDLYQRIPLSDADTGTATAWARSRNASGTRKGK